MRPFDLLTDAADLVLGRCCQVCGAIGPEACPTCLARLRVGPRSVPLTVGSAAPRAAVVATEYAGAARHLLLAYKEDGHRGLARPLGTLLADAIAPLVRADCTVPSGLVPIPGHRHAQRGFDALDAVVRGAQRDLAGRGIRVGVMRLLRTHGDYRPAKTLGRAERQRSIHGAFRALPLHGPAARLIVVDDVITTGTTIAEGLRALGAAGIAVHGVAAITAVRRPSP